MFVSAASAGPVVGWRTDTTGRYPTAKAPTEWSEAKGIVWKTPIPKWSNSSAIVVGEKVFVCAEPTDLVCLNKADGKILWTKSSTYDLIPAGQPAGKVVPSKLPKTHPANGHSSATPVSDGKVVAVVFNSGVAACYDLNGNRKWIKFLDLPPHKTWGSCSTPMIFENKLLVHFVNLVALDLETGKELWKAPKTKWSWGSPAVTRVGKLDVVVTGAGDVVRLSDGKVLASRLGQIQYGSPLVHENVAYYVDGKVGRAVKLLPKGNDSVEIKELWTNKPKKDRYYGAPLFDNGLLYVITQKGVYSIIDAADGKVLEEKTLSLGRGTVYSSITLGGKHLFLGGEGGTMLILEAGKGSKEIARHKFDAYRSCPVFEGSRMYLRTNKFMYCIGE